MAIQFLCPHCSKQFRVADSYAGKLTKCKQCGETMRVPELAAFSEAISPANNADEDSVVLVPDVALAAAPVKDASAPVAATDAPTEHPAESDLPQIQVGGPAPASAAAPQKPGPAPAKKPSATYFNVNKGTISLSICSLLLLGLGGYEASSVMESSSTPTKLTVLQLVSGGVRGNRHVLINGGYLWTDGKLTEGAENAWTRVWIPFIDSKDPTLASGGKPRVLMMLRSRFVKNSQDLAKRGERRNFQGMIVDGSGLSNSERSKLNSSYPELRNVRVLVLDEGEKPPSAAFMAIYIVAGLVFAGAAGYLMFLAPPIEGM